MFISLSLMTMFQSVSLLSDCGCKAYLASVILMPVISFAILPNATELITTNIIFSHE